MKKRIICALLAIVMLISALPLSAITYGTESYGKNGNTVRYGDVNGDCEVNSSDVDLLARYLAMDTSATIDLTAADVDVNDKVDMNDLLNLVKYVKGDTSVSLGNTVTVTFDTNGGTAIDPITVVAGSTITAPEAQKANAVFLGWYTDKALTTPFYSSDPIVQDVMVYAKFAEVSGEPEYTPAAFALQDQPTDLVFDIQYVSGELEPQNAVTLISADGSVAPKLTFTEAGENKWKVSAEGGYTEGASYTLTLAEGYIFEGKDESIREASFYIYKEEIANFTTNEDIIYIQDTADMTYKLSDGTTCEVLDSAVLYNSDDVITGSFIYAKAEELHVGDTLCIYVTTSPTERDYIDGNYDNDPTAYIVVETISGSTVTFRGMTMQGENSDVEKLISLPSTIPFSVLNLPAGNGTVDFNDRDLAALVTMYNTGAPEEVKVGDFLAFYVGNFGSLREGDLVSYKRVTAVNGTTITYVESSQEELLNAINLFLENDVEGEKMIENIDRGQLEQQVMQQVEQTGFAEDALKYLSSVVGSSDEFYDYIADNKIIVYDENGVKLTEEQIKAYGLGNSFELADDIELGFNITTCDGKNSHFENGIKVTLNIGAEFEVDIGKDGKMGSLKIELGAAFTQEVCIDVSINATADITWIICVPKINDIVFSSAVDVMSYTGVSIEAKFYTQEASDDFFDKLEENWGDKLGEDTMKKIKEFKEKYEEKFDEDSLGEDIEGFWESQTALIEDLIKNGEITEEQAESCLESHSENHIVQTFFSKAHLMNDEDYNAGITELAERYAEMLGEEDNGWLELCKIKIFDVPINLWIFQISIEGNFVVRANVNIALGANLEYEIGKRYINWFSIFGNGSGAEKLDLVDERFAFQFYAMGHVGLKAGILIEVKVGIISTKIGNVGISAEVGAFAELYGYFQYTYTKTRPSGGKDWEKEESLMGALYFEFGLYVDINVKAELLSVLEKSWEVYSEKWTLLSAGSKSHIYGFATELEDGEKIVVTDKDNNSNNGIRYQMSEDLRSMKTLDMVSGDQDNVVKPWVSYYGYNFWGGDDFSLTQHEDKTNFTYTLSSRYFSFVPVYVEEDGKQYIVDYEIQVNVPENVHYLTCDLRLVWTLDKLCWSKYDMAITIPLVWTDLADEELTEYRTATVKVGNEADGYRTVWSERYIKGSPFELPSEEEILELADYAWRADTRYSGYTGYTHTNRGENIKSTEQSMIFDTVYYFDMTTREYTITVEDVQNTDGSTKDMTFTAKYGEKFDFSALTGTGMESGDTYTIFSGFETKLDGKKAYLDPTQEISGTFAYALLYDLCTYHAKYTRNSGTVTYKFNGINLEPITKVYKKGQMPSQDDYLPVIKALNETAYVSAISPAFNAVSGDITYAITVTIPPKPLEKYTITYESGGGSTVASQTVEERSIMMPPAAPTRAGYTFAGWYYEADLVTPVSWNRQMPSMDFTLYAKWTVNNYKITFNAGDGTATGSSLDVTYGQKLGALPTATRANYIFLGWYTAASGGTQYTANTVYNTDGNITLYAHWQIKATIASSNFIITEKTMTYNGSSVTLAMSNNLGLDMSSFTVEYKRQGLDRSWSTDLPVNAGTYDVRVKRSEDGQYLAFEQVYTAKLVINKKARIVDPALLIVELKGYNISIDHPDFVGEGNARYSLHRAMKIGSTITNYLPVIEDQTSGAFQNLRTADYRVDVYIAEEENYLKSNVMSVPITVDSSGLDEKMYINGLYAFMHREIESVGDFTDTVNLTLTGADGKYRYTYSGKIVDNYSDRTKEGYYNCFTHPQSPVLSLTNYEETYSEFINVNLDSVSIDRDGLYQKMLLNGDTSTSITATLTFDEDDADSGNVWNKTFNISLPATAAVSEEMDTYYSSGEGNVTVQTQEDMDYLYVTLGLNNNPGVWGVKNTVRFDADALELVSEVEGSLSSYYTIESSLNDGAYTLLAYRDNVRESYATGTFVTLTFKKKAETIDLSTALTITNDQTIDDQAQPVIVNDTFDMSDFTSVPPTDDNTYLTSDSEIVNSLGKHISERNPETLTLHYKTNVLVAEQDISAWYHEAIDKLDSYAYFGIQRYTATASKYTKDDVYYYTLNYTIEYYTTNAEEQVFEEKLDEVIAELSLSGKSDLEKILIIYDYVCKNVTYDTTAAHPFTAYGALIEGEAVCQGYALLLMRMLEEASIDAEVILGDAEGINHMWNIVKLDGEYFLLDATWDSADERECYFWFLKGSDTFERHTPDNSYAIGTSRYDHESTASVSHKFGDVTCVAPATCLKCNTTTGNALGHLDINRDHACDRGCAGMLGEHADSATDNNHVCDYGCGAILEACSGATAENNYTCVVCGNEVVKDSVTAKLNAEIKAVQKNLDDAKTELQNAINANEIDIEDKVAKLDAAYKAADALINSDIADLKEEDATIKQSIANLTANMIEADATLDAAIKAVQKNLDDAKTELQNAIDANETDIEDKVAKLDAAYKAADALINSDIADLKKEDATIKQSIANLTANMTEADATLDAAIKAVQKNLDDAKTELNNAIKALDEAMKQGDADLSAEIANLNTALAKAKEALEKADAENKADLTNKIEAAENALQAAIDNVQTNLENAKTELNNAIKALDEAMKQGDADLSVEIANLNTALAKAKEALEKADAENKADLTNKIEAAENSLQAAIDKVQTNVDNVQTNLEKAKTELNNAIETLKEAMKQGDADLSAEIAKLNTALAKAKEALEKADAENKNELVKKIEDADKALEAAIEAVQKNLDNARAELDKAIADGDTALDDKISNLNAALKSAKAALEATDAANKTELEGKITNAQTTLQAAIDQVQTNLDSVKAELDKAIADLDAAMKQGNADLSAEIDAINAELANAQAALEKADEDNKAELVKKIEDADKILDEAIKAVQKNLDDAKAELAKAIADGDTALDGKITNLNTALNNAVAALEQADADNKAALVKKIEDADASLQAAIDKVASDLTKAQKDLADAIATGDASLSSRISSVSDSLSAAKAALEKADSDNKAALEAKIEAAEATLDAAIKAVQKNLDDAKEELNKAIADGDTALDDKISALNEALATAKAALEATDSANKSELNAKIDDAYSSLNAAIKAVQKNLDEVKNALEEKDNELQTFIIIVCVISGVAFCGCGTLAVFYIIDKKKKI